MTYNVSMGTLNPTIPYRIRGWDGTPTKGRERRGEKRDERGREGRKGRERGGGSGRGHFIHRIRGIGAPGRVDESSLLFDCYVFTTTVYSCRKFVQRCYRKYVDDVDKFWTLMLIVETVNKELTYREHVCLLLLYTETR